MSSGGSAQESIEIRPNGEVINRQVQIAPAPPMTAVIRPAPDMPIIDVAPGVGPDVGFGRFGPIEPIDSDDRVMLGGTRFWVVSLWSWLVLAIAAVVLTVRRISLPANRES